MLEKPKFFSNFFFQSQTNSKKRFQMEKLNNFHNFTNLRFIVLNLFLNISSNMKFCVFLAKLGLKFSKLPFRFFLLLMKNCIKIKQFMKFLKLKNKVLNFLSCNPLNYLQNFFLFQNQAENPLIKQLFSKFELKFFLKLDPSHVFYKKETSRFIQ